MWVTSGRFSLFDDTKSAEFCVMIREITVKDTGTYQCGVDISLRNDIYTPVKLKVKEDLSYDKSISKTVHVGGDLNISFKYPQSLRNHPKFLCKGLQPAACVYKESVRESRKDVHFGKFSLYDDRTEQIFTVSIRNAAKTDSGEFWCGAEAAWTSDHGYKVYFTQINLTVTVIAKIRFNKVPLDDCNYEEIKNIMQCPALDTSTVYSTPHLPTNPSDPSFVYANHDLPSIPCDSGVYSNAQLPKKPEQDIYSTVQLPTSCEAEKSTQGPIYATVSFHTKSTRSNDAVAKIRFNKKNAAQNSKVNPSMHTPSVEDIFENAGKFSSDGAKAKGITQKIMDFIAN
ncbi:polymeric immunoglobulin receptor-like isoform X2 [Silurus asotus]|nr:polymeric immunoglobulin receptor-like isoform X2 [Silurus asotus]